jgi:hypothetical protein
MMHERVFQVASKNGYKKQMVSKYMLMQKKDIHDKKEKKNIVATQKDFVYRTRMASRW